MVKSNMKYTAEFKITNKITSDISKITPTAFKE